VKHILNYIAHLHNLGLSYRTINLHTSTISMTLPYVNGAAVGTHPLVSRMCKGSFTKRPPPLKVPSVFMHWTLRLSYAELMRKCAFIFAILSGRRLSELFRFKCDVNHLQISNDFVQLMPVSLSKTEPGASVLPFSSDPGERMHPSTHWPSYAPSWKQGTSLTFAMIDSSSTPVVRTPW
jgi:hypothetical protein